MRSLPRWEETLIPMTPPSPQVEAVVRRSVAAALAKDEATGLGRSSESLLAGAMARALTYVNRKQVARQAQPKLQARWEDIYSLAAEKKPKSCQPILCWAGWWCSRPRGTRRRST